MEVAVLKRLQGATPHVCEFLGCGRNDKVNYVVMTLLGPSLSELRKRQPHQRFSHSTVLRVGIQIISAIRCIHNCGFLHRDVKPSNFAIGASSETSRTCYMLDFGLSRQYTTLTGEVRQPRAVAGFRGTVRYASLNAHLAKDLGRHDDLWSVFYMLVELAVGQLPWRRIRDKEEAGEVKAQYDHKKLIKTMPFEFLNFLSHLKDLTYSQKPDYAMLINVFRSSLRRLGIHDSDPYDWEQDYSAPSLTTASVGSPPAVKIIEEDPKKQMVMEREDGKLKDASSSKTNVSEVADLSNNGQNLPPTPQDTNKRVIVNDTKVSPIKPGERIGGVVESSSTNKQLFNVKHQEQRGQPDGEDANITREAKVDSPTKMVEGAEVKEEEGIGASEKLEIENRYESEDETSSTVSSTESEEEEEKPVDMEVSDIKFERPQPKVLLQVVDSEREQQMHRYGSITPMKSIHTDSLNRFFDIGVQQHIGSSETIGNKFPQNQSSQELLEKSSQSGKEESGEIATSSDSESHLNRPPYREYVADVHPETRQTARQGYSSHSASYEEPEEKSEGELKSRESPAPVIMLNDKPVVSSSSTEREEMEVQAPRVIRLSNGLHDSESSRSIHEAMTAISIEGTTKARHVQMSTNEQDCPLNYDTVSSKNPNNGENSKATSSKLTPVEPPTSAHNNGTVITTANLERSKASSTNTARGTGRKLPPTPSSVTYSISTTSKILSPLQSNSPLSHRISITPQSPVNEVTRRQDKERVVTPPLLPRPPPNPPPANYTANILARRRRFVRSQPK